MVQIAIGKWRNGKGSGNFTLFALGEDGLVYKSIWKRDSRQHEGWLPMCEDVLPEDFKRAAITGEVTPDQGGDERTELNVV